MRMSMRSWLRLDQRLTDRYREQARSHRVCRSHIQCGSELARDAFRLFPKFQMRTPAYPLPPDSAHSTPVSTGSNQTPETTHPLPGSARHASGTADRPVPSLGHTTAPRQSASAHRCPAPSPTLQREQPQPPATDKPPRPPTPDPPDG